MSSPTPFVWRARALISPLVRRLAIAILLTGVASATQAAARCEIDRTVNFGGMNWESNLVLTDVQRLIIEKGYGCKTDVLPTETLAALAALVRGDLDVNTEIWLNSMTDPWKKAEASGKVQGIGSLFMGGEAWFIPRYTAERLPGLKAAADLPRFKDAFTDPEEPAKGRFYGCPAGWACEIVSGNLYRALGLQDSYTLYSPGTGAAQKAALTSAYKRKQNVVFYYWFPTPLVGAMDLVQLDLPAYDADAHQCLTSANCTNPKPSAYPENPVFTAVNTEFARQAPALIAFMSKMSIPLDEMNAMLAYMEESGDDAGDVALWFLKNKTDLWSEWVPAEVAERVKAAL